MTNPVDGSHRQASMWVGIPCIECGTEFVDPNGEDEFKLMPGRREEPITEVDALAAEKDMKLVRRCAGCSAKAKNK